MIANAILAHEKLTGSRGGREWAPLLWGAGRERGREAPSIGTGRKRGVAPKRLQLATASTAWERGREALSIGTGRKRGGGAEAVAARNRGSGSEARAGREQRMAGPLKATIQTAIIVT